MRTKLTLVEGIPGSGKSAIAKRIKEYLESLNIKAALFNEGDIHYYTKTRTVQYPSDG